MGAVDEVPNGRGMKSNDVVLLKTLSEIVQNLGEVMEPSIELLPEWKREKARKALERVRTGRRQIQMMVEDAQGNAET